MSRIAALVALAAAVAVASPLASQTTRGAKTRDVFVSFVDKNGAPVENVTVADVTVREDGQAREVLAVAPAKTPLRVALLADNSQVTMGLVTDLRKGLGLFVSTLLTASPDSTISYATFGERPTPVQDFTSSQPVLTKAVERLFHLMGSGAYMMDAIIDAAKVLKKDPIARQAIVVFVNENGDEFSNNNRLQVEEALRASGAALWVVVLQGTPPQPNATESRDRSAVIGDMTTKSGGASVMILNRISLADKMKEVARALTSQYQVTYGRPEALIPPTKIEVETSRKDVRVRAPRWTGQ
jgi:VWFA-related protein